jgi:hypothetical protein
MKIALTRTGARTGAFLLLAALVLFLAPASCRATWRADDDRRFEELQARLDADIASADAAKAEAAALSEVTERERRLDALDHVLVALIWAKVAAATALMAGDPSSLDRIETQRLELMARASRVAMPATGGTR